MLLWTHKKVRWALNRFITDRTSETAGDSGMCNTHNLLKVDMFEDEGTLNMYPNDVIHIICLARVGLARGLERLEVG